MPYYLKWPADSGAAAGNNKLCQLSGIATTGAVNIALKFAENVVDPSTSSTKGAYLYDGRRTLDSTTAGAGGYFLENNNAIEQSGTSNYKLNGSTSTNAAWRTALADDVYSFDTTSQADGVISVGARYTQTEHMPLLALKSITITDINGTHIVDMSSSNGTADTFTSLDGIVTLKLFGFTGGQWVFYSSGASNTIAVSATLPKITGSLTLNEINPSYVISVNGQLPKLTGSVALNEINPVFTAAVAGQLPKLAGSIALNQFANNRQVVVNGVLPKLTGAVTLNRLQPNNQVAVSGQLPRITAAITLRVPDSYPAANPNDYTVAAYLSTDSTYTARLSESSTINAIISSETTYAARLN